MEKDAEMSTEMEAEASRYCRGAQRLHSAEDSEEEYGGEYKTRGTWIASEEEAESTEMSTEVEAEASRYIDWGEPPR